MIKIDRVVRNLDKITPEMFDTLSLFTFNQYLSIYQIHKMWKDHVKKISYKNMHIKIQKLIEFNLIERETNDSKFKERELERGAKYYRLSEEGIFALFLYNKTSINSYDIYKNQSFKKGKTLEHISEIFNEYEKEIFKNHQNCNLFELFLYPWISIDTIKKLSPQEDPIGQIRMILNDCCNVIKERLLRFPSGINNYYLHDIFKFNPIVPDYIFRLQDGVVKLKDNPLLSFLKDSFSLNFESVKVKKENENRIILYNLDDKKEITLEYDDEKREVAIISNTNDSDRLSLKAYSINQVVLPNPMLETVVKGIDLKFLHYKAVFLLIMGKIRDDLVLFKNDKKFMDMLDKLKNSFDIKYNSLLDNN